MEKPKKYKKCGNFESAVQFSSDKNMNFSNRGRKMEKKHFENITLNFTNVVRSTTFIQ